ncbi:hypothetical protein IWQ56_000129 [Coemansia nantahalensis]|nr:hypothetical protein IWQ56_000129 [Coemansia nantahalensis]
MQLTEPSMDTAEEREIKHDGPGVTLIVKGDRLFKSGRKVRVQEAYNLEYVQGKVACPKLYGYHQEGDVVSIEMEYIKGETLEDIWPTLDDEQRRRVADNVIREMRRLHEFSNGDSRTCSITGGAIFVPVMEEMHFEDEQELNKHIAAQVVYDKSICPLVHGLLPTNSRFCLSHGDLHADNIMVKEDMSVVFIDWANLGFLPEYWDAMKLFLIAPHKDDMSLWVVDPMRIDPKTLAAHQFVLMSKF